MGETKERKIARKSVLITLGIICVVLVAGLTVSKLIYGTNFSSYYDEFGNVSVVSRSYNFSPPVSMYNAIKIALESDRWNASSLSNMTVCASLEYWEFWGNSSSSGSELLHYVTQPANDYSPVQVNNTTYRYIWDIVVEPSVGARSIPPPGLYWVDAATGEIVPHGILA
ncbi:MAG: hypothetical protein WCD81_03040 [Candidatus Bathyarchaeia archaeon]